MPSSGDALRIDLLPSTLDLIVLRTLAAMGPQHAYGIAARVEQVAAGALTLNQGTLYPALVGYLIVAAQGDPRSIVPSITDRLRSVAPSLALDRVRRVTESLEDSRAVTRFSTQLALLFAALDLLLSAVGVYGLAAGDVTARWREIAIRLALGASGQEALWTVIRPSVVILAIGATLGFAGALGAGPALASLLHGVSPVDGPTIIGAPAFLGAIGIVAVLLAAARVLRSDPAATLRNE